MGRPLPAPAPFQGHVEDPLLAPAAPAQKSLATWAEALALVKERERSTDLISAEAALERAQGRARQALGVLLPNLRASATVLYDALNSTPLLGAAGVSAIATPTPDGKAPTVPIAAASVGLSQSIVDVGAWYGLAAARASERSARLQLSDVRRRVLDGLAKMLVAVVAAERAAELNRLGLRYALERAALTERTQALGAATRLDVLRVQQDLELARGTVLSGDEQLRRTREALGLALGIPEEVGVKPGFQLVELEQELAQKCGPLDWERRPDLEAARQDVESARKSQRQAAAGYAPTLGLSSSLAGFTTNPGPGRFATWSIAGVLSIPIWEGGTREGLVRERRGAQKQLAASLESSRRQVAIEVARARRGASVAASLAASAARSRTLSAETDALTRRAFEVGRGSSLELVQTAAALRQADLALAAREFELVQARLTQLLTEASCDL